MECPTSFVGPIRGTDDPRYKAISGKFFRRFQQDNCAAYYSVTPSTTYTAMMMSIVGQILSQAPTRFKAVRDLFQSISREAGWTQNTVLTLLRSLLCAERTKLTFLVMDDIHRSTFPWRERFAELLEQLNKEDSPPVLKVLVFGLDKMTCNSLEEQYNTSPFYIDGQAFMKVESQHWIDHSVQNLVRDKPYLACLRSYLEEAICRCRTSLELALAFHAIDHLELEDLLSLGAAESRTQSLPQTAAELVSMIYERLSPWGRRSLGWILNAQRPIEVEELAVAVTFFDAQGNLGSDLNLNPKELPPNMAGDIGTAFGPLLNMDGRTVFFSFFFFFF
jgi:hypothetical protein